MTWLAALALAAWGGSAAAIGFYLGLRRGAKVYEDLLEEDKRDRALRVAARGSIRVNKIRFTR